MMRDVHDELRNAWGCDLRLGGMLGFASLTPTYGLNQYVTNQPVRVLRSTSSAVDDFWSVSGQSYPTVGGATQLFSPQKQFFMLKPGN